MTLLKAKISKKKKRTRERKKKDFLPPFFANYSPTDMAYLIQAIGKE